MFELGTLVTLQPLHYLQRYASRLIAKRQGLTFFLSRVVVVIEPEKFLFREMWPRRLFH